MAAKTSAAPTPDDEDETEGAQPSEAEGGGEDDNGGADSDSRVLLTVLCHDDGSYTVIKGDEDEDESGEGSEGEESGGEGAEGEGAEGAEAGGEAGGGEEEESQGETYHSVGEAMKAILDIFREDESSQQGNNEFSGGYKGESPEGDEGEAPATVKY